MRRTTTRPDVQSNDLSAGSVSQVGMFLRADIGVNGGAITLAVRHDAAARQLSNLLASCSPLSMLGERVLLIAGSQASNTSPMKRSTCDDEGPESGGALQRRPWWTSYHSTLAIARPSSFLPAVATLGVIPVCATGLDWRFSNPRSQITATTCKP
jgi:hypothetical protein